MFLNDASPTALIRISPVVAKGDVPLRAAQKLLSAGVEPIDMPSGKEIRRARASTVKKGLGDRGGAGLCFSAFMAWLE
eukprot:11871608-Heterocapsa_arctica.AAC.1